MIIIKIFLITILVLYAIGFIFRLWLKHFLKKASKKVYENDYKNKREGEVTINYSNTSNENTKDGEYVDFEEIK